MDSPEIVVLKFADSKVPEFKEVRNKDWIPYGEGNNYGQYLTYLYNKSAKHNAIINGKCNYILGSGFAKRDGGEANFVVNRDGERLNELAQKAVKDLEIYGGYKVIVIRDLIARVSELWHYEFFKVLPGKEGGFWYKCDWNDSREQARFIPEFDINSKDPISVYSYNEYRPGNGVYPLPGYIGCNNYIETDIEISKFHLSAIRNGMMPSKMIQFFNGDPGPEGKKEIEKSLQKKYEGSENAGKFILVFNPAKDKSVEVTDLSASELDKQFDILGKACQQEIFTGHQVVSPMLFGIKTEGQLGGTTELKAAYEIFTNTYAKPKQAPLERFVNLFAELMGKGSDYYIEQLDPIGLGLNISEFKDMINPEYFMNEFNIPQKYWNAAPVVEKPAGEPVEQLETNTVNDAVKNLTAKQHQQLLRIIRQYGKGQLTKQAAKVLIKSGLGLSEADIDELLGVEDQTFSAVDDLTINVFSEFGSDKDDFVLVSSKKVKFESDEAACEDEVQTFSLLFAEVEVDEKRILDLIRKDKRITPEVIAEALNLSPEAIIKKLAELTERGIIESKPTIIGQDEVIERNIKTKDITVDGEPPRTEITIKYSYEGPRDSKNRAFCAKLLSLNKYYSRYEIEQISQRLGYSVFDRRGGFWTQPDGSVKAHCRHRWVSNILVKKRK